MATQANNIFTQFVLTDIEQVSGATLNHTQLMVLQNLRAEYAQRKVMLKYDPTHHQQYLQEEAEIHGWINCLNFIIQSHEDVIMNQAKDNKDNNPESGNDYTMFPT